MILAYILSITLMILLPVALAAGLRRVANVAWLLFAIGSLTFIVSQVVHLPLNSWLARIGFLPGEAAPDLPLWRQALTLGLTAGLCEELARAGGYALIQRWKPAWMRSHAMRVQDSLMLGLGHGGFESMVFGGLLTAATVTMLLPLQGVDLDSLGLVPEQVSALRMQLSLLTGSPLSAVLPLLERLIAISAHVTFSLMVWQAFAGGRLKRDWYYIPLAVAYHAAIDFMAVYMRQSLSERPLTFLLVFILLLLPGWAWAAWTVRRYWRPRPELAEAVSRTGASVPGGGPSGVPDGGLAGELNVFMVSLNKELRQLWRTRRLLVMAAVFLFFGMGSPLMAKLTPQMLNAIPGAEQFAELIPTPTAGDAMTQYIKNLSQFGFLLAVLLGMGAVVGEKERGIAPMILSKPMPRWAFIAGKFAAQFLMYAGGFVLASIGAYYYTIILFGALEFGQFMLLNGLLLLWLLTFASLSLLGSTLGKSTAASAGIGLLLCVALMLAGSLPLYGALLPGGLLGWATQLGMSAAGVAPVAAQEALPAALQTAANGGAAASALVIIVLALVLAIGIFEQQEL